MIKVLTIALSSGQSILRWVLGNAAVREIPIPRGIHVRTDDTSSFIMGMRDPLSAALISGPSPPWCTSESFSIIHFRALMTTQRYMHLSPAAIESAIQLLDSPAVASCRGNIVATAQGSIAKANG